MAAERQNFAFPQERVFLQKLILSTQNRYHGKNAIVIYDTTQ